MKQLKRVILLLNLDIFGEKYHLLAPNQHPEVMKLLLRQSGIFDPETASFAEEVQRRAQSGNVFQSVSPNRKSHLSAQKIEQGRRIHLQLNYMYHLNEDTESIRYLDQMLNDCQKHGIESVYLFLPVNYEMGEKYFGDKFYEKYDAIKDTISRHIIAGNGQTADFSYILKDQDFIRLRSVNEGLREHGRQKLVTEIQKLFPNL